MRGCIFIEGGLNRQIQTIPDNIQIVDNVIFHQSIPFGCGRYYVEKYARKSQSHILGEPDHFELTNDVSSLNCEPCRDARLGLREHERLRDIQKAKIEKSLKYKIRKYAREKIHALAIRFGYSGCYDQDDCDY